MKWYTRVRREAQIGSRWFQFDAETPVDILDSPGPLNPRLQAEDIRAASRWPEDWTNESYFIGDGWVTCFIPRIGAKVLIKLEDLKEKEDA